MIKACNLKKSSIVDIDGTPHQTEQIQVQTPSARGGATLYKVRFRNVQTRQKVDKTFRGDDTIKEADFVTRDVQYLYKTGDRHTFMDMDDYSQFELSTEEIEDAVPYLVDDMEGITALMSDGRVLGIRLPDVVELQIESCDPSIKGASATARSKPATMTTGLVVQVPEYISPEEVIRVDTRTNEFLSRA
ncbi:MAG: elongation factor P-like protein YeiP [Spartobacteria bacterium]|nr:elongation factor P-like protein YeiP [Spartobacteria bacterium]